MVAVLSSKIYVLNLQRQSKKRNKILFSWTPKGVEWNLIKISGGMWLNWERNLWWQTASDNWENNFLAIPPSLLTLEPCIQTQSQKVPLLLLLGTSVLSNWETNILDIIWWRLTPTLYTEEEGQRHIFQAESRNKDRQNVDVSEIFTHLSEMYPTRLIISISCSDS